MAAKPLTLLEQWLDGVPNANNNKEAGVKREKKEFVPSSAFDPDTYFARTSFPQTPAVQSAPLSEQPPIAAKVKTESRAIDSQSEEGIFGWASVDGAFVPVIYRGTEGLVPVRIVESKIISQFSSSLTWSVFSCINIRSYYVTDKEAALLNEINSQHSDYFFGYETYTAKDVVVCLQDVFTLHTFLQTSREIFQTGLSKSSIDWLGFVSISGSLIAPFIAKPCPTSAAPRRFVPQSLIAHKVLLDKVQRIEMDEWDTSYIRMLLIYSGLDHVNLLPDEHLCCLDDLLWDSSFCPLHIEQCSPPLAATNSFKTVHKSYPAASGHSLESLDDAWMRSSTASSPNTTLRSLHQVAGVDVAGMHLKAINLKPYSNQQAVFVGDIVSRMFRGVSLLTVIHILGQILQVKLYECTRLHEDAFVRSGYVPLHGDKLIQIDVLKKCLPQLKQVILAGLGVSSVSGLYSHH